MNREETAFKSLTAPPEDVEMVKAHLRIKDNNMVAGCLDNYIKILLYDPLLSNAIRFNLLTERIDIVKQTPWLKSPASLTDFDIDFLVYYFENNYGIRNDKNVERAISIVSRQNEYHPIKDYLLSLKWDGEERIRYGLNHFLGSDISEYTYQALKLFMLGAISRVFNPGCKFESMLCLVGGQGAGKSTFFRFLAIRDEWFSDDLKKLDDENIYRKLQGHWIIEMSEMLATANARSIEEIKSFLSRSKETYKVPYATHPEDRLRQCVFGGTSNVIDFLPLDRSGNRRFMPIMVYPDRAEVHILDDEDSSRAYINQMWAEAMELYNGGNRLLTFSKEISEEVNEIQSQFMTEDIMSGVIQEYLDNFKGDQVCSKQIFHEAFHRPAEEPRRSDIRDINSVMNNSIKGWIYFSSPRSFPFYGRQRGWEKAATNYETNHEQSSTFEYLPEDDPRQMEMPFD